MSGQVLPDISALIAKAVAEALEKERSKAKGMAIAWAKDHEGKAVILTWPGKRGRYIEVGEVRDLLSRAEEIEAWLKANG